VALGPVLLAGCGAVGQEPCCQEAATAWAFSAQGRGLEGAADGGALAVPFSWNRSSRSRFWKAVGEARPQIWLPLTEVTRKVDVSLVCIKLGNLKRTLACGQRGW